MSSHLLRITPQLPYDIHVLRTYTRELNAWIVRLQLTYPHASDTINHVIYALNNTFHEVELSYMVWRNERVQTILQHGFQYARDRIQAALWRRERGKPAAMFPAVYPSFQFAGVQVFNPSPERQQRSLPPAQAEGSYYQPHSYGAAAPPAAGPWASPQSPQSPQPQVAQQYAIQNPFPRHNEHAAPTHAGYPSAFAPEGNAGRVNEYPPPPYPPKNWKPPDPVPGSPPVTAAASAAAEVATRYLEAVQKAINICIDLDAM